MKYQLATMNRSWDSTLDKNLNLVYGLTDRHTQVRTTQTLYVPSDRGGIKKHIFCKINTRILKSSFPQKNTCLPYFSKTFHTTTHSFKISANIEYKGIRNYPLLDVLFNYWLSYILYDNLGLSAKRRRLVLAKIAIYARGCCHLCTCVCVCVEGGGGVLDQASDTAICDFGMLSL